ncbi:MAG: 4-alpha-glucanotransferase, partial [Oscillospiraceae bacterium]|nr:4-alpha-glucanotransferase [Oscillospiraceae bacterium]
QLWGNPIYRWAEQQEKVYEWWGRRVASASLLYDYLRIDHFRGFDSYWAIPADEDTAINGEWVEGPG